MMTMKTISIKDSLIEKSNEITLLAFNIFARLAEICMLNLRQIKVTQWRHHEWDCDWKLGRINF
jgi:hypothetical protein